MEPNKMKRLNIGCKGQEPMLRRHVEGGTRWSRGMEALMMCLPQVEKASGFLEFERQFDTLCSTFQEKRLTALRILAILKVTFLTLP